MTGNILWQAGQGDLESIRNLGTIQDWWATLSGQKVLWQQRLVDASQVNWDVQRFDESLLLDAAELRGVTLYWQKFGEDQERNLTAVRLELDQMKQQLDIYSQAQANLVVRVSLPQVKLQTLTLVEPELRSQRQGEKQVLIARDVSQGLEVQLTLTATQILQLRQLFEAV